MKLNMESISHFFPGRYAGWCNVYALHDTISLPVIRLQFGVDVIGWLFDAPLWQNGEAAMVMF
jgi:hypothetical protein